MISSEIPKISCIICGTTNEALIASFENQCYPNKELVVLTRDICVFPVRDENHILIKRLPDNTPDDWAKDLAIELATGEWICWWNECDPFYLSRRMREKEDDSFFPKQRFYEHQNMLYCGRSLDNEEYYEI